MPYAWHVSWFVVWKAVKQRASMERIFAGLTSYLTVTFKDKDGAARAATSASYRIEDVDTGQEIRGDTAISPGAIVEITMMPSDNALVDDDKPSRCGA